jgi:hypothetical protein
MKSAIQIPNSKFQAAQLLRRGFLPNLQSLSKGDFLSAWCSIAYLFPGLHPDGFDEAESGWPRVLRRFASEAWRRYEAGELRDEELYPSDATWAGLYDQMALHKFDEIEFRFEIAIEHGMPLGT